MTMTSLRFDLKFRPWVRKISWKTLVACIAGAILASTAAYAESPVAVPATTAAALARMRTGNIHWVAFRLSVGRTADDHV